MVIFIFIVCIYMVIDSLNYELEVIFIYLKVFNSFSCGLIDDNMIWLVDKF